MPIVPIEFALVCMDLSGMGLADEVDARISPGRRADFHAVHLFSVVAVPLDDALNEVLEGIALDLPQRVSIHLVLLGERNHPLDPLVHIAHALVQSAWV